MKKIFLLLLIATLALFVLTGCDGLVPSEGEGEGEGEEEVEGVTVEIDGLVELAGKNWIACGNHEITITFPAPVENALAYITSCSGYYGTNKEKIEEPSGDVVLFPNEDKTVWTGSCLFGCYNSPLEARPPLCSPCCASYVEISSGECSPETCISFPIIVDCDLPYAKIEVTSEECECDGCEVTFESTSFSSDCAEDENCCGDYCSGLAGWSIAVYEEDPFDLCCETPCEEPIYTCSGTECPIKCTTDCLEEEEYYYVVANLVDNVGNEVEYYGIMGLNAECEVIISQYLADGYNCECTTWDDGYGYINHEYIGSGSCDPWNNCMINGG